MEQNRLSRNGHYPEILEVEMDRVIEKTFVSLVEVFLFKCFIGKLGAGRLA